MDVTAFAGRAKLVADGKSCGPDPPMLTRRSDQVSQAMIREATVARKSLVTGESSYKP